MGQNSSAAPTELQAAMTAFIESETRAGTFVITG
jgi:hypothetical protein